mgnify:CR=1 FL=1
MSYQAIIGKNNEVALPDKLCSDLEIKIGDILIFEAAVNSSAITMSKHCDQTLSDDDVASAGNLARVFPYDPE